MLKHGVGVVCGTWVELSCQPHREAATRRSRKPSGRLCERLGTSSRSFRAGSLEAASKEVP